MNPRQRNSVSVVVCTRNPRLSHLKRALEALEKQTLPLAEWELLFVDNASDQPLDKEIHLDWHPNAHYLREERLGLVHARLRGISEARGELVVFVDDDNVLKEDYLANAQEIASHHTMLGAWSGQVLPEFEVVPTEEIRPLLPLLAIRELSQDTWSSDLRIGKLPSGAGLCVRRAVAQQYRAEVSTNALRLSLGHTGSRVSGHDDTDLVMTSVDLGFGIGLFRKLVLAHLIPARRLNETYLLHLAENSVAALFLLKNARQLPWENPPQGARAWLIDKLRYLASTPVQRKLYSAGRKGEKIGRLMAAYLLSKSRSDLNAPAGPFTHDNCSFEHSAFQHAADVAQ